MDAFCILPVRLPPALALSLWSPRPPSPWQADAPGKRQGESRASRRPRRSRENAGEATGACGRSATRAHAARLRESRPPSVLTTAWPRAKASPGPPRQRLGHGMAGTLSPSGLSSSVSLGFRNLTAGFQHECGCPPLPIWRPMTKTPVVFSALETVIIQGTEGE